LTNTPELQGRTALVTGGSGDIGGAIVLALARRGADVVIHTHRNREQADVVADQVRALGRRSSVLQADLAVTAEVRRLGAEAQTDGPIDILVNNAGTPIRRVHWSELDDAFIDLVFALNYRAPLYLTQALAPEMARRGRGVIINILSTAAHTCGTDTVYAYGSAKGALMTLTRGLARSLAPQGVRVLSVSPGTVDTNIQRNLTSPELLAQLVSNIPIGRIGRPEEIGEIVAFMATDAASFIVGETVEVNGGVYML
jgi:3-oxoacyl-[acyl-carrier protein] reductase